MKQLIEHILKRLGEEVEKTTLREVSARTGVQITKLHRITNKGKRPNLDELVLIASACGIDAEMGQLYDFLRVQVAEELKPQVFAQAVEEARRQLDADIEEKRKAAEAKAIAEIWERAEQAVASKYGMTPELMAWKLSAPVKAAV